MGTSRVRNSSLNLATSFLMQIIGMILKFIIRTVFIRTLGVEYLGINGLFADIISMLSLTELGMDTAINIKLYKPVAQKDYAQVRLYLDFYKRMYRLISCVVLGIGLVIIPMLPTLIKDYERLEILQVNPVVIYLLYLFQSISTYSFFAYKSVIIKVDQKMFILNIINMFKEIIMGITQIIILIKMKDFVIYTAIIILFNIFTNFVYARIAEYKYPQCFVKDEVRLPKLEVRELFKDCLALFVFKVDTMVLKATDNIIISAFLGLQQVGLYSNYLMLYTTFKGLLTKFYASVKASMGNIFAIESVKRKYFFFELMNYLTVILYGTAAVGIAVVGNEFIACWIGQEFIVGQSLAVLIGIELFFSGVKMNLNQIRNISGVFRQMWYRPVIGIIINLVVSIIGVNLWGLKGVVLGTILASVFANYLVDPDLIHKYTFDNYKPVRGYYLRMTKFMVLLIIIGLFDYWLCSWIVVDLGWISVLVHAFICAVTVPGVFVLFYFKSEECQYLLSKCRAIVSRR